MNEPSLAHEAAKYPPDYFTGHGYSVDPRRAAMYRQERERIMAFCSPGRVLDVGCGVGAFLEGFVPAWERHGVDISAYARAEARRRGLNVPDDYDGTLAHYPDGHFDLVVMRGVLQHLFNPFDMLRDCVRVVRPGGALVFLATPNARSPVYALFGTLPALDPPRNWQQPSDVGLANALTNLGLRVEKVIYPYIGTPYASPLRDTWRFALRCAGIVKPFAFWRSMMEVYARKPITGD